MSDSATPTVEDRLRSSLVMCNTLKHCVLLADETTFAGMPVFTPKEVLKLLPEAFDALTGQLTTIKQTLATGDLNLLAPAADATAPFLLLDAILAVAGASDDTRAIELAERAALPMVSWRALLWTSADPDYQPVRMSAAGLTDVIEQDDSLYTEARTRAHQLLNDDPTLAHAVAMLRARDARAAYYLGLARGWHALQALVGGSR